MTPLELTNAVKTLTTRLAEAEARISVLESQPAEKQETRKLCPHCNEKPAHYFHVKNCPKKNKNDRSRDQSGA